MLIKLDNDLCMPKRAHPTDAGMDLVSSVYETILPGEQKMVDTGVSVAIPPGFVGLLLNRSSQGKIGIQLANSVGVIDPDYRGNIKVLLKNNGSDPYHISQYKTRVAQLVIVPIWAPNLEIWDSTDEFWETMTERGTGGFGSTGV